MARPKGPRSPRPLWPTASVPTDEDLIRAGDSKAIYRRWIVTARCLATPIVGGPPADGGADDNLAAAVHLLSSAYATYDDRGRWRTHVAERTRHWWHAAIDDAVAIRVTEVPLRDALLSRSLSAHQRVILWTYRSEGTVEDCHHGAFPDDQLAEVLDMTDDAVRTAYSTACRTLRRALGPDVAQGEAAS